MSFCGSHGMTYTALGQAIHLYCRHLGNKQSIHKAYNKLDCNKTGLAP